MKISVNVKPNSRENSVMIKENGSYLVRVTCPPEHGKANEKVIELLSKKLRIAKSKITLLQGNINQLKLFEIDI